MSIKILLKAFGNCFVRPYRAGDSFTHNSWLVGTLSGGNNDIMVMVPVGRPINASGCVFSGSLSIRQNGSYLAQDMTTGFNTTSLVSDGVLRLILKKPTGNWGGTNNSPVAVQLNGTIKFV